MKVLIFLIIIAAGTDYLYALDALEPHWSRSGNKPVFSTEILSTVSPVQIASDLTVEGQWFFVEETDSSGSVLLRRSTSHSVKVGQHFGCVLKFVTTRKELRVRSELRGPGSLEHFHRRDDRVTISQDRHSLIAEVEIDGIGGATGYWWSVDPGDPLGEYEMRIWLDGTLVGEFHFSVP